MTNYRIQRLDENNISCLYDLYAAVYNKKQGENYFYLKYNTKHTGTSHIGYLAFDGPTPVSFYGAVPVIASLAKKPVPAAQSCDIMTHPAYRRQGIFIELARRTFELAKEEGIQFMFGFPNENSYPGFIKHLGFIHHHTMNRYSFGISNGLYQKILKRFFKKKMTFDRALTPLKNQLLEENHDGIVYDGNYFESKKYNTNFTVQNEFCSAWLNNNNTLWIGAMCLAKENELEYAINSLKALACASPATIIISPGTKLDRLLKKMQAPQSGFHVIIKDLGERII